MITKLVLIVLKSRLLKNIQFVINVSFYVFFKTYFYHRKKQIRMIPEKHKEAEVEALFTNPEPWEKWETKLVWGSIITAVISLFILGIVINWLFLK